MRLIHLDTSGRRNDLSLNKATAIVFFGCEDKMEISLSDITGSKVECSQMTYEERVEQAIAGNDIESLVKFIYGFPCKCTKMKGEPMCICKMLEKATRAKIVPLPLFSGKIERV
jgi:hypothetical protein